MFSRLRQRALETKSRRCRCGTAEIIRRDLAAEDDLLVQCYAWYHRRVEDLPGPDAWPLEFTLSLGRSRVISGGGRSGIGVFVSHGNVPPNRLCMVYPGVVFEPSDPKLFFGFRNHCMLRRADGAVIDGKPNGLSGMAYRSLHRKNRDLVMGDCLSDCTWQEVEDERSEILADLNHEVRQGKALINCGHYVNHLPEGQNNVEYTEKHFSMEKFYLPLSDGRRICMLPYSLYNGANMEGCVIPGVALVSNRKIQAGEELTANYENIIPEIVNDL